MVFIWWWDVDQAWPSFADNWMSTLSKRETGHFAFASFASSSNSAALGLNLFEALPVFQQHQGTEKLYFDYDPHWTPEGHRVMAAGLASYIEEHQMSRWCRAR